MLHVGATGIEEAEEVESHNTERPIENTDVEMVGKETVLHNRGTSPAFTWKG
jgi:hypothetical protein